jgi:16S rRNA processing protein RimM
MSEVEIGNVAGPHGIRGEVKIHVPDPRDSSVLKAKSIVLKTADWSREYAVIAARPGRGVVLARLGGVVNRNGAESLRGARVFARESDLPKLPSGQYYLHQLRGMSVADRSGTVYGPVVSLSTNNAQDLLVVAGPDGREWLVPFVGGIVAAVLPDRRLIVVDPPEGLFS